MTSKNTSKLLLGAAIAGLVGAGMTLSAPAMAKTKKEVKCFGVNSCSGKGQCKTAKNDCAGKNGCKGQGFMKMTAKACKKAKGSTEEPKA